ncbi:hypothetical protein BDV06DRAFT_202286 [Aspergillus oleicola]
MPPIRRSKRPSTVKSTKKAEGKPEATPSTHPQEPQPKDNRKRQLHLLNLPREILTQITSYLPSESTTCLTLTSHSALSLLGTASWADFTGPTRRHNDCFNPLYTLLRRDQPELYPCSTCRIMHPPLKPPSTHRRTRFTRNCFHEDPVIDFWPRDETTGAGYSLVFRHLSTAFQHHASFVRNSCTCMGLRCPGHNPPSKTDPGAVFAGDFTFVPQGGNVQYRLVSEGAWSNGGLVIMQQHRLKSAVAGVPLTAAGVRSLLLRVCAHLSTTTAPPPEVEQGRSGYRVNGPMLSHAVTMAFPENLRGGELDYSVFRRPTPAEMEQYRAAEQSASPPDSTQLPDRKSYVWRCTACPTKFRVEYVAGEESNGEGAELVVTAGHFFGRLLSDTSKFWKMFAVRVGPDLPPRKRNCEYWVTERVKERGFPDFGFDGIVG